MVPPRQLSGEIVIGDPDENGVVSISYTGHESVNFFVEVNGEVVDLVDGTITVGEGESEISVMVSAYDYMELWYIKTVTYTAPPVQTEQTEQTDPPMITFTPRDAIYEFTASIECTSPEAVLYYRFAYSWDGYPEIENEDWICADDSRCDLYFNYNYQQGFFIFQAYAIEPDKEPSPTMQAEFLNSYDFYRTYRKYYDIKVDGIYYEIMSGSTLAVSSETIETTYGIDLLFPDQYKGRPQTSYNGDVVIPPTVEYNGTTYTVTSVNPFAFVGCELGKVELPNTITVIGDGAFYDTSISGLVLPDNNIQCGVAAFGYCRDLSTVVFPNGFTSIPGELFLACGDLTSVILGNAVDTLGWCAFIGSPLAQLTCHTAIPPGIAPDAFDTYDTTTLFVPDASLEDYRCHAVWGRFTHIVPFIGAGPGDVDGDGRVDISDVTSLIDKLLLGGAPAYCDVDGNGKVDISDVTALIDALLQAH